MQSDYKPYIILPKGYDSFPFVKKKMIKFAKPEDVLL